MTQETGLELVKTKAQAIEDVTVALLKVDYLGQDVVAHARTITKLAMYPAFEWREGGIDYADADGQVNPHHQTPHMQAVRIGDHQVSKQSIGDARLLWSCLSALVKAWPPEDATAIIQAQAEKATLAEIRFAMGNRSLTDILMPVMDQILTAETEALCVRFDSLARQYPHGDVCIIEALREADSREIMALGALDLAGPAIVRAFESVETWRGVCRDDPWLAETFRSAVLDHAILSSQHTIRSVIGSQYKAELGLAA